MGNAGKQDPTGAPAEREPDGAIARIGTVVDKYTIVQMLGRGGMGAVYEARHAMLARRFAIKFLLPEFAKNREILRRFENEARAAGGLEHPNVAAVTDFGRADDGSPYLVMEFLEGEDGAKLLRRHGPLPVSRAANLVMQACRGLAVAHKATIVHRDLKPENLFVTDAGDGSDLIKVLDFGIAKLRVSDASVITGTGATFGTAFYMSPEQARGAGEVDPRTDVWSLGVVLYELLAGRKPFLGEQFLHVIHQILSSDPPPLATLRSDLPPRLVAAVEAAMKKDLAQRLPSVVALAEALAPFAGTRAADERRPSPEAVAATVATPGTNVGAGGAGASVGELSRGARASIAPGQQSEAPVLGRAPAVKVVLALAVAVALAGAVVLVVVRRSSERSATVGTAASALPPASNPGPNRPTERRADIPAPSVSSATNPGPAASPKEIPASSPTPTSPAAAAPAVRSMFEHGQSSSNRHAPAGASKPRAVAAPTSALPNPAPPLEKPTPGHRLEIDKDDPFGGP
jgi:serine/threonine protein kinase